jgi:uncharacterized Rmd1/YagE family protein
MSSRQFTKPTGGKDRSGSDYGATFDSNPSNKMMFRTDSYDNMDGNVSTDDGGFSDNETRNTSGGDEFGGRQNYYQQKGTGRQRKKVASRGKGGEFQAKRRKRRVYACCIGSEIDTIQLVEYFKNAPTDSKITQSNWLTEMYTDTLRIYRNSVLVKTSTNKLLSEDGQEEPVFYSYATGESKGLGQLNDSQRSAVLNDLSIKFHDPYCKEIFVYEFGAVVFWGFPAGEEIDLLSIIREFVSKGRVTQEESTAVITNFCHLLSFHVLI